VVGTEPTNTQLQYELSVIHERIGLVLLAQGALDGALREFEYRRSVVTQLIAADANNIMWQRDLSVCYNNIGTVLERRGKLDEALKLYRQGLAIRERLAAVDRSDRNSQNDLQSGISRIGGIAYEFIQARNFATALEVADQAISLAPEKIWVYANRAYALMFLGRVDEARALYLQYRGRNIADGSDKRWEADVLEDFAEFRKAGLTHPLMDEIEKQFTGT